MNHPGFFFAKPVTLSQVAEATGATLKDNSSAEVVVAAAGPIEAAPEGSLSFVENRRYVKHAEDTAALAVLCAPEDADKFPARVHVLVHEQPYRAYALALGMLFPSALRPTPVTGETGVSPAATISETAKIERDVIVEAGAVIGTDAAIGAGSHVLAGAVIGAGVQIGRNTTVGARAIVQCAFIGDNVIIHPGVAIGQDGFGFAMGAGGHLKVPQIGRVIIQDNVEIGANTTIDRGSNRDTVIGEGTKIDNLVQIGHNVVTGRHCVIVSMAGISGSATLGDYVVVAGQAGIVGHVTIGDGAQVGGGAGVHTNIKPGEKVMGYPSMDVRSWMKMNMLLKRMIAPGGRKGGDEA